MKMRPTINKMFVISILSSAILSACGGGSTDNSNSDSGKNAASTPVADNPVGINLPTNNNTTAPTNNVNNTNNNTTNNSNNSNPLVVDNPTLPASNNTTSLTTPIVSNPVSTPTIGQDSGNSITPPADSSSPASDATGASTPIVSDPDKASKPLAAVVMPLEVMSPTSNKVVSAVVNVPAGNSAKTLTMTINNLSYDNKASVQVNNGAWINLANSTANVLGNAKAYGGIGGGYDTLSLTVPVTGGINGKNTINFRFNTSDGVSSGYRVLSFNLLNSTGQNLIASTSFTEDDPTKWTAPSSNTTDIAAGKKLWQSATLTDSPINSSHQLKAHCMDCHSANGSDLYKFNYSNNAIIVRSQYHGLSQAQGSQIASYIRSLATTLPVPGSKCRPWNPPYQPGPGLDSAPVSDWTCGAGLEAISENDLDTLKSIFPNGVDRSVVSTKKQINLREIPIGFQLPDWNHWVPRIHPKDAWGDYFTNGNLNKEYAGEGTGTGTYNMRNQLSTGGINYATGKSGDIFNDLYYWGVEFGERFNPPNVGTPGSYTVAQQKNLYGTAQWQLMKSWEIAQDFNLETSCPTAWVNEEKAPKAEMRGWCGYWRYVFNVSPHILQFPENNSMFGSVVGQYSKANQWYYLQILLNPGSGAHNVHLPTDWQYAYGLLNNLSQASNRPEPIRNFLYVLKGAQEMDNGVGVTDVQRGWTIRDSSPLDVWNGGQNGVWKGTSVATEQSVVNAFLANWMDTTNSFNINSWQREGQNNAVSGETTCFWSMRSLCAIDYVHGTVSGGTVENFPTWTWNQIPQMQSEGIDKTQVNRLSTWLNTAYPSGNYLSLIK